jgi:hypothetical protein
LRVRRGTRSSARKRRAVGDLIAKVGSRAGSCAELAVGESPCHPRHVGSADVAVGLSGRAATPGVPEAVTSI